MAKSMDPFERKVCGRRLRAARKSAGVTQRELGEAIGCTQSFISHAEYGDMMLRPMDYPVVADLLGVSVRALIGPFTEAEEAEIREAKAELAEQRRRDGFDPTPRH